MVDQKSGRLQKVRQILYTMDCQNCLDSNDGIWIDGGLWHAYLPKDEPNAVYLGFIPNVGRDFIVETAITFTAMATLMELEVYPAGTIAPDSTSPVAGWITRVNEK